jgi:hypothetical protein
MTVKSYLASLPERVVRSVVGLGAGAVREIGEVALPEGVRRSQLYQNVVASTLRVLIERVGGAEGAYPDAGAVPDDFLARKTAGNAVEVLGLVAFRASPVWVLAALADLAGMGRHLIPEIADALEAKGLLEGGTEFSSVDQMLDGLERTSARLATTINTPPLDIRALREEWAAIQEDARSPARRSAVMALGAARALPDGVRWLSASVRVGASRTGQILAGAVLDHYRQTLAELQQVGYVAYARRQLGPYFSAAAAQFSPERPTLTRSLLDRLAKRRARRAGR